MKRSRKGPWWLHALGLLIVLGALRLGWFDARGGSEQAPPVGAPSAPSGPSASTGPTARSGPSASTGPTAPSGPSASAAPSDRAEQAPPHPEAAPTPVGPAPVGFTSKRAWREHFAKHGAEFGKITAEEYLRLAQVLRDAPRSQLVLELVREDGVITRFDRASGAFLAFHRDLSIRTFFRPRDGEAYFERQASR